MLSDVAGGTLETSPPGRKSFVCSMNFPTRRWSRCLSSSSFGEGETKG